MVAQLDPDLPVEPRLPECIVLTSNASDIGRTEVAGLSNLAFRSSWSAPKKQIQERNLDAIFIAGDVDQFADRRRSINCRVVSCTPREEGEGLSIVKNETRFL